MDCPSCGHGNRDAARFCEECGAALAASCSGCGTELRAGAKFCDTCGTAVGARQIDPQEYTPKHLADKILQSKSALEGERKQVSILFADVKGSLELSEKVDPEVWHGILDRFFQIMSDGIHRFEGTVNQFTGDGVMALFGAPIAHEDHAQRACYAALQLRDELAAYEREVKRERSLTFSVRIGINSGEVVVGKIGDDLRMDYTAQGHTVGLAARMQELASPNTTYLTGATASLVDGYFDLEDLGPFKVKGVSAPVPVYQLTAVGSLRTRLDVSRARGLTRFVGRDGDLRTLDAALEQCLAGSGVVVGLVAEAGVGKSRLCYEFLERCRARGLRTLEGQAVAHGKNIPFLPILQIFRSYFDIQDQESDRTAREKIAGRLLLLDEAFRDALPLLFDFLGVPDPERPAPALDADLRQRRLFEVLRRLVANARVDEPIVTLVEDLHWLDAGSESWLREMVDAVGAAPGLVIVNFRPEYRAEWAQKSYYRQIALAPLGPDAIRELLDDLLGSDPSVSGLAERIHARTAGNPFFTEEVIQALIEAGNLEGTRGRYRLVTPVAGLEIPNTVQSILAARIDRLIDRAKQVLHTAAVIGKEFAEPILEEVVSIPRVELAEALDTLKSGEFIYEQALYPVAEYAFKHPLTQEVALHSQLRDRRQRIHAEVARAIEAASPDKLDEQASLLAHHWEEAGEKLAAARWHDRAAKWAGMSHAAESVRHLRSVNELLRDVPPSDETMKLRVHALAELLAQGIRVGLPTDVLEPLVAEGDELLRHGVDPDARIHFLRGEGTYKAYSGRFREGQALLAQAVELADEAGSVEGAIGGRMWLSIAHMATGPVSAARAAADAAVEQLRDVPDLRGHAMNYDTRAVLSAFRAWFLTDLGKLDEAAREAAAAIERARQIDDLGAHSIAQTWASRVAEAVGDDVAALAAATRGVELAETLGTPNVLGLGYIHLGRSLMVNGEWDRAVTALERALEVTETMMMQHVMVGAPYALALLGAGRAAEAQSAAEESIELCRRLGADRMEIDGQLALARILEETEGASARGRIERAIARAETLTTTVGCPERLPWVHLARGEREQARRLFEAHGAAEHARRLRD